MTNLKRYWLLLPYLAIIFFPSFYLWATLPAELRFDWRYCTGQLLGFTGASLLLMQLVLATRWQWLDRMIGFDKLTRVHKWAGLAGFSAIVLHPTFITLYYFDFGWDAVVAFIWPGWRWETLGMIALDLMVVVITITIFYRRWHIPYHWWKRIHLFMYVSIFSGFLHSLYLGSHLVDGTLRWYWLGLGGLAGLSLLHRRCYVPWMAKRYRVVNHEVIAANVHHVTFEPLQGTKLQHRAGQFVFVQFQAPGITKEWHPFTVSSPPSAAQLTLSMKESGDWTKTLSKLQAGTPAKIEGPYGQFSYTSFPTDERSYVFIAGGIGITPLHSMITELLAQGSTRSITLLYSARSDADFAFKAEFDTLAQQHQNVHITYNTGRLDQTIITQAVPAITTPHYFVCGPKPMMTAVRKTLSQLQVPITQVHFEEFALN